MSLVGHWPLHERSGQANDLSGNDNHGTVNGATQGVAGVGGLSAYSFDGTDDYVLSDAGITLNTDISGSAWVVPRSGNFDSNPHRIVSNHVGGDWNFDLRIYQDQFQLEVWDGSAISVFAPQTPIEGELYHLAFSIEDGNEAVLYVNGKRSASDSVGSVVNRSNQIAIGYLASSNDEYFDGQIADVRVYDRALTP